MNTFSRWLRQPTTIHACGVIAFAIGGGLSQLSFHNPEIAAAVGALCYVLVHLGINDNSTLAADTQNMMNDIVSDIVTKQLKETLPELWQDAGKVITDVVTSSSGPTPPPTPTT